MDPFFKTLSLICRINVKLLVISWWPHPSSLILYYIHPYPHNYHMSTTVITSLNNKKIWLLLSRKHEMNRIEKLNMGIRPLITENKKKRECKFLVKRADSIAGRTFTILRIIVPKWYSFHLKPDICEWSVPFWFSSKDTLIFPYCSSSILLENEWAWFWFKLAY